MISLNLCYKHEQLSQKSELLFKLKNKLQQSLVNENSVNQWINYATKGTRHKPTTNVKNNINETITKPAAIFIAASDFSIDPHDLTGTRPGTFYIIRNAAGIVTPGEGKDADLSIGATLEFAVKIYKVRHIIVMASPGCGLLSCLLDEEAKDINSLVDGQYLPSWINLTASAISRVANGNLTNKERKRICSQELTKISFENLMTYPWILDGLYDGSITLHGWYYDAANGQFSWFDPANDGFVSS